jgi:hypothetical protein
MRNLLTNLPDGFRIRIDKFTDDDSAAVGLLWHADINGLLAPAGRVSPQSPTELLYKDKAAIVHMSGGMRPYPRLCMSRASASWSSMMMGSLHSSEMRQRPP